MDEVPRPSPPDAAAEVVGAPVPTTPLIGRLEEVAEVAGLLARCRLLTVTGAGGSGKTRLALAVAQRWAAGHPDTRVSWVQLSAVEDPGLVEEHVAAAVDGDGLTASAPADRPHGRADLVVLDNCEHLIDAVAELTDAWLTARPTLRILATSRTPLRLFAERRWPLPPLRLPPAGDESDLAQYDAVRLFLERAQSVRPDLRVGPDDAAVVAAICRRLDGNPLAIELCAARMQVLGLSQVTAALDDAGRLLAGRSRSAPPRHRTLWDTLDWSHRLLDADEARVFAVMGVFAGAVGLDAIVALAGPDSLDTLTALVEHSLVRPVTDPAQPGDARRFELADPVRQYARCRLEESGHGSAARDAHLRWYAACAAEAYAQRGGPEQTARFAGLRADLAELRAALSWARASGRRTIELKLAADLAPFATASGLHREARAWLEQALAEHAATGHDGTHDQVPDQALLARARQAAGTLAFLQCDYSDATAQLRRAEEAFGRLADESGRARCLQALASIARERGDYPAAIDTWIRAQRAWTAHGDAAAAEVAGIGLAFTLLLQGSADEARRLAEQRLPLARARRDPLAITDSLIVLGGAALADGDLQMAAACLEDALARALDDDLAEARAYALEWLAVVARERGDARRSAVLLAEALQRQYELGDLWRTASVLVNVARCECDRRHPESAARALGLSAALLERIGAELPPVERRTRDRLMEDLVRTAGEETVRRLARAVRAASPADEVGAVRRRMLTALASSADQPDRPGTPVTATRIGPRSGGAYRLLDLAALGREDVRLDGRLLPPAAFGYAKPRELLFFLAERGPADKAQIGLALWPDASPAELRSAFHTTLHHLRGAVGADRVVFANQRYRLADAGLGYDVGRFREGLAAARAARTAGSAPAAVGHRELDLVQRALQLYSGDFLPGLTAEWAESVRTELRSRHQRALLAAGRLAQRAGRQPEAVAAYERLVELDPLAEVAHRELMLCFAALGERGRALRQYEVVSAALHEQLGIAPDPRTTQVRDRLHRSLATDR